MMDPSYVSPFILSVLGPEKSIRPSGTGSMHNEHSPNVGLSSYGPFFDSISFNELLEAVLTCSNGLEPFYESK